MANLREEVPMEFADDERWYKYFTKKTLIVLMAAVMFTYLLTVILGLIHLQALGLIIGILVGGTVFAVFNIKLPNTDVLHGGGSTLDVLIARILARRRNGCIMTAYPEDAESEDN